MSFLLNFITFLYSPHFSTPLSSSNYTPYLDSTYSRYTFILFYVFESNLSYWLKFVYSQIPNPNINFAHISCSDNIKICTNLQIQNFPTYIFYTPGRTKYFKFIGSNIDLKASLYGKIKTFVKTSDLQSSFTNNTDKSVFVYNGLNFVSETFNLFHLMSLLYFNYGNDFLYNYSDKESISV
jgi:hypothetical protein